MSTHPGSGHAAALTVVCALPARPESAAHARAFIERTLRTWRLKAHLPDALIVGYELVANAIVHARTPALLRLRRTPGGLRVEVGDGDPSPPRPEQHQDLRRGSGRGLPMVMAIASRWGSRSTGYGKVVWAELRAGE
jgi:anti-sigma regulatory factor (Ser/Thr protein kinase)